MKTTTQERVQHGLERGFGGVLFCFFAFKVFSSPQTGCIASQLPCV